MAVSRISLAESKTKKFKKNIICYMNLNNYTIKAQEIIQQAQQIAFNNGNPNIETNHVLKALLDDENSPVEFLLKKNNVNVAFIKSRVEDSISKLPKVSGTEPAQNISRDLNSALLRANSVIKDFKDEFVSVEHLLLGIVHGNDDMGRLL